MNEWQIRLMIISTTNPDDFETKEEYNNYIDKAVECALAEQDAQASGGKK